MEHPLGAATAVCRRIAATLQPPLHTAPLALGSVTLLPHQREAVVLVSQALTRFGGALLADPVGTGKTYVALTVASAYPHVTVVVPAGLRSMWHRSLAATGVSATLLSFESLSRRTQAHAHAAALPQGRVPLLIVDEAHHARNPATQRFARLAHLAWGRDVLLLSATPVHNRPRDLHTLCSLFLGESAARVPPALLARVVCRRLEAQPPGLPVVAPTQWIPVTTDAGILAALQGLPPPVPPADGRAAAALGALVLLRQWCSSDAALVAALNRRLTTGTAMQHRLERGQLLTRAELRRWIVDTGVVQLDLALDAAAPGPAPAGTLDRLRAHVDAARALRDRLHSQPADASRLASLHTILDTNRGVRAVLFTHSADTAHATWRALVPHYPCALLAGRDTRVASGPVSRDEVVRCFAPHHRQHAAMPLDVLVATDVLSEGVDLHDAGVLVHLDLPWTMARLEQRVGRLRRLGATHERLLQFAFEPPGGAGHILRLIQRLARKAGIAARTLGADPLAFALPTAGHGPRRRLRHESPVDAQSRLRAVARAWQALPHECPDGSTVIAAVGTVTRIPRFVAVVDCGTGPYVVAGTESGITTEPGVVAEVCEQALTPCASSSRDDAPPVPRTLARLAMHRLHGWCAAEAARLTLLGAPQSTIHRRVLRRLGTVHHAATRHRRREFVGQLDATRAALLQARGAGAEHFLADWLREHVTHPVTLADVVELRAALAPHNKPAVAATTPGVLALLLLVPLTIQGPAPQPRSPASGT